MYKKMQRPKNNQIYLQEKNLHYQKSKLLQNYELQDSMILVHM